jgi:hypothetical protein
VGVFTCVCLFGPFPVGHGQASSASQDADHVGQLIGELSDSNPQVRLDAIRELRDIQDTRAVEPLIAALKDKDWRVRQNAATALGRSNDPRAVDPLTTLSLADPNLFVRQDAIKALGDIKAALASSSPVNPKDNDDASLLIQASQNDPIATLQDLLSRGVDVNASSKDGMTALMWAAGAGHIEVVKALLAKGADTSARRNDGLTALMAASLNGHNDVVQTLLANGANVNAKMKNGDTALIMASDLGQLDVVETLLAKGANIDATGKDLRTALDAARQGGHDRVVMALLAKGADCDEIGAPPYTEYPNGFVVPKCSKLDFTSSDGPMEAYLGGKAFYELGGQALPIMTIGGFQGGIIKFNTYVSGYYIGLANDLEFAWVSGNFTVHRTKEGRGILTLVVGKTEWLLPDFDLSQASTSKNYIYTGRAIEYRPPSGN